MKFVTLTSILLSLVFFTACSSNVQTNKIPNEKKYFLPSKSSDQLKEQGLDSKVVSSYANALDEFFKKNMKKDDEPEAVDIYQVGLDRGYFNE